MTNGISEKDMNGTSKGGPSQNCGKKASSKRNTMKKVAQEQKHAPSAKAVTGKGKWG
tara:strand:+ start:203 stop:373 length:171 start_codon:yes stop_codon:yes gene_type:complete